MSLGDFDAGGIIDHKFTTYRPSTGAPFTLAGTPTISVYKDNSTTESTSGVTLTADFDSKTGLNHVRIDTSSDGTFYSAGSFFEVVITTGTVDGVSAVGSVVEKFTLRRNSTLKPATAGRTIVVDANGRVDLSAVLGSAINALIAGRLDVNLGTSQAGSIINGAHASAELTNIANALLDDAIAGHNTAGTVGKLLLDLQTGVTVSAASITAIATAVAQRVYEGTLTLEQAIRLILASTTGKLSGAATTTVHIRDVADSKDRVLATVDASGNRTGVILDGT